MSADTEMRVWIMGLACILGLSLGAYLLGAGIYDLCFGTGPFRPAGCESGPGIERFDFSLVAAGTSLALVSAVVLSAVFIRRGNLEPNVWAVTFARLVFAAGTVVGIMMFLGSGSLICDPFGAFGLTGTFCGPRFDPYEAIGPLLALISLTGLAFSFRAQRMTARGPVSV